MTDFLNQGAALALSLPLMLVLALVLDWVSGDMRWFFNIVPHPVVIIGKLIGLLDRKLNRADRSETNRVARGAVVTAFVVGLAAAAGGLLDWALEAVSFGWMVEAALVSVLLASRSLFTHVGTVAGGLKDKGLEGGRAAVAHIVGRDPKTLHKHGVSRAAVESLAENFADGVIAPAFWYLLLGLPGICAYKAVNTLDSMIGYRTEKHKAFGMVAARLDDVANWVPARLTGLLLVVSCLFSTRANPARAARVMIRFAGKHASPNAGWPEAAMAGGLDFALGGPRRYPGGVSEAAWIGEGRARLEPRDIRRAQSLYMVANFLLAGTLAGRGLWDLFLAA